MKYFNKKYECLDAKDDFCSQRKSAAQGTSFDWMQAGDGTAWMHVFDDDDPVENDMYMEQFIADDTAKMCHEICHDQSVLSIKELMMQSGWMDSCIGGLPDVKVNAFNPIVSHTSARWQALVKAKKEELAALKLKNAPVDNDTNDTNVPDPANVVRIINQE